MAEKIKELVPSNFQKVFFTCSGSEANDTQVKFIWYYNNARGLNKKKKIISRVNSYHGGTIMSASLSGVPIAHMGFDLPLEYVLHTDCPHYYRYGKPGESESEFCNRLIASLRELIEREGADTIAAFIAEPIMGAGGVIIPPKGYYEAVQMLLRENDIIFIDDEVMNGFGRTGNWWGFESMEFLPDTITIAKQLTSAYAPLGAVLLPNEMYESFVGQSKKFGVFGHGFTYGGHPLSCAIGLKAIEIYQKRNIVERVRDLSKIFEARMKKIAEHPLVGETRYKGLLGGIEIVADKKTKTPFPMHAGVGTICMHQMLRKGVILHAIIDTISVCPPMIIKEDELNHLFDSLEAGLNATMELLKSRPNPA